MPDSANPPLLERLANALSDDYEVLRPIGRGGMASVFLARERALNRLVALKVLDPQLGEAPLFRARFQREAETVAQLQHPNIVHIYRVGEADGLAFYAMAFVEGENLAERLKREVRLPPGEAVRICSEILAALSAAHKRGIIHRDIKPENVLIERESGRALVTDFGIARIVAPSDTPPGKAADREKLTAAGVAMGTPRYMSPEQASGEHDLTAASDIYALGILFYEMLSGAYPYEVGPTRNYMIAHLTHELTPLSERVDDAPEEIQAVVERMLARNPEERFASADDVAEMLTATGLAATGPIRVPSPGAPDRRRWVLGALGGVAVISPWSGVRCREGWRRSARRGRSATVDPDRLLRQHQAGPEPRMDPVRRGRALGALAGPLAGPPSGRIGAAPRPGSARGRGGRPTTLER